MRGAFVQRMVMGQFKDLDCIGEAFAAAAIDPSRWSEALDIVVQRTAGCGAGLFPERGKLPTLPLTESMLPAFELYVRDRWYERDLRDKCRNIAARRGGVATDLDIVTPDIIAKHPYYQEFLAPFGLRWFAGVVVACDNDVWALSIQRTVAQGPFSPEEQAQLSDLSAKLQSAIATARMLGFARAEGALAAFEASGSAAVLLDRYANVVRANAAAEKLLRGDVRIVRRRLVCWCSDATAALDRSLHALIWNRAPSALMPPVILPKREASRRPILAYPMRLAPITADAFAPCHAVVVLADLDTRPLAPLDILRRAFQLTPAEARVAQGVASGASVEQVAEALGVTLNTARVQLKAVFLKVGVSRQAELVAALARILGAWISPHGDEGARAKPDL